MGNKNLKIIYLLKRDVCYTILGKSQNMLLGYDCRSNRLVAIFFRLNFDYFLVIL